MSLRSAPGPGWVSGRFSRSVSDSVLEWEPEMENGRPVARKKQTDSSSPPLSLKQMLFRGDGRVLARALGGASAESVLLKLGTWPGLARAVSLTNDIN